MKSIGKAMFAAMALAMSLGALAWAQTAPAQQSVFQAQDADGDAKVTVTEYQAYVSSFFKDQDGNKDGKVDPAEKQAAAEKHAKAMDVNADSFVALDEYVTFFCGAQKAAPAKPAKAGAKKDSFRSADLNRDGAITSVECVASKTTLFKLVDKDKDGKLSREEIAQNARAEFAKADSNKDGFVTLTEVVAFTVEPKAPGKDGKKAAPKKSAS